MTDRWPRTEQSMSSEGMNGKVRELVIQFKIVEGRGSTWRLEGFRVAQKINGMCMEDYRMQR